MNRKRNTSRLDKNNMPRSIWRDNNQIFHAADKIVSFNKEVVGFLKGQAIKNIKGRSRVCMHNKPEDILHEMIIAITSDSYIRPHRHINKIESFHLIEGEADIVIFSNNGEIQEVISFGESGNFYYRLNTSKYHTLIIYSPVLVIHEITNGPFDPSVSDFAEFSPEEGSEGVGAYVDELRVRVKGCG